MSTFYPQVHRQKNFKNVHERVVTTSQIGKKYQAIERQYMHGSKPPEEWNNIFGLIFRTGSALTPLKQNI